MLNQKIKTYRLELIVFLGGAIGMILEVVGSRVVSPYFGNSLVVWTNLIGVILGCLSLGYYYGGKIADKEASFERLEKIIFFSAVFLIGTAFLKEVILEKIRFQFGTDLRAASFTGILLLFGPTSLLLGMVSPMAAKLRLINLVGSGAVVGSLYALSTFGSISGTFAAGFILIPRYGNSVLLYGLTLSLIIVSVLCIWKIKAKHVVLLAVVLGLFYLNRVVGIFKLDTVADIDSLYNRIIVRQFIDNNSKKVTMMSIDNAGIQSAVLQDYPDEHYLEYTKMFKEIDLQDDKFKKVLVVGGGGYIIPRDILENYPEATIDVVEIDASITQVARDYFFLESDPRLNIFHQDARSFVNESQNQYDLIVLDAFNSITPPPHLTTKEFMVDLKDKLNPDGVMVINMISGLSGEKANFLVSELATLQTAFLDVRIIKSNKYPEDQVQNIFVLAYLDRKNTNLGSPIPLLSNEEILTDDWSPVEYLTHNYYR